MLQVTVNTAWPALPASIIARIVGSFQGPTSSIRLPLLFPATDKQGWSCVRKGVRRSLPVTHRRGSLEYFRCQCGGAAASCSHWVLPD